MSALCWPVLVGRGSRLLGDELGSAWRAMWTADAARASLGAGEGWPLSTSALGAPFGGSFASPAPLFDVLSAVVRVVLGPVTTFDLLALAHLGLAAAGAWALARAAGLAWQGALVSATVFGFNSLLLSAGAASGAPEVLGMAWVPWALAALVRLSRAPGPGSAALAALALVAVAFADLHLALLAPLLLPFAYGPALVDKVQASVGRERIGAVAWTVVALAAAALVVAPLLGPMLSALADPDAIAPPGSLRLGVLPSPDELGGALASFATLSSVLLPGEDMGLVRGAALTMTCVYAGWVALGLAVLGAGWGRLRWVALSVAALLLAMGPYLLVTPDGWRPVPVSWWSWLRETWPVYKMITTPVRALAFGYAGLAVLAGFGAERLMAAVPRAARALPWAISGAVILDILALTPIPAPLPSADVWIPAAVTTLRERPEAGAVLDWPQREASGASELSRYAAYQLWHGRPVFFDLSSEPGGAGVEANPFFVALEKTTYGEGYRSPQWSAISALPLKVGVDALASMGFSWLVWHPWHAAPERREAVERMLSENLILEVEHPDGSRLYRIQGRAGR